MPHGNFCPKHGYYPAGSAEKCPECEPAMPVDAPCAKCTTAHVEFGWGAKPISEQFPVLSGEIAGHLDADNTAIIRCHVRGLLTDSQRDAALKKLTKRVEREILSALNPIRT